MIEPAPQLPPAAPERDIKGSFFEHLTELRLCLALWEKYQEVIGELDTVIAAHLRSMRRPSALPPLDRTTPSVPISEMDADDPKSILS